MKALGEGALRIPAHDPARHDEPAMRHHAVGIAARHGPIRRLEHLRALDTGGNQILTHPHAFSPSSFSRYASRAIFAQCEALQFAGLCLGQGLDEIDPAWITCKVRSRP